jgi:hypothetical protein
MREPRPIEKIENLVAVGAVDDEFGQCGSVEDTSYAS